MHRNYLLGLLSDYETKVHTEMKMQERMIAFIKQYADCFERTLSVGHITGSAWVVNAKRDSVFLLHHRKLDKWLQPGGHSDGDPHTLNVALRETHEESGVCASHISPVSQGIFDIDIHRIPQRKNEAAHFHYDVRFLLEMDEQQKLIINAESNELAWIELAKIKDYSDEPSILRMIAKTQKLGCRENEYLTL